MVGLGDRDPLGRIKTDVGHELPSHVWIGGRFVGDVALGQLAHRFDGGLLLIRASTPLGAGTNGVLILLFGTEGFAGLVIQKLQTNITAHGLGVLVRVMQPVLSYIFSQCARYGSSQSAERAGNKILSATHALARNRNAFVFPLGLDGVQFVDGCSDILSALRVLAEVVFPPRLVFGLLTSGLLGLVIGLALSVFGLQFDQASARLSALVLRSSFDLLFLGEEHRL